MGKVIVVEFVTLDGIVEDPDGSAGMPKRRMGVPRRTAGVRRRQVRHRLDHGVRCAPLGRATWEMFAARWPSRTGEFADARSRGEGRRVSQAIRARNVVATRRHSKAT